MPKSKTVANTISLIPDDESKARPRLHKLIIKNFRTIGENPIEIYLNDIVVLVGANNAGKSSILRAYEAAMNAGAKLGQLSIDDFPNYKVDENRLPEIEVQTIISENKPGDRWIKRLSNGEMLIREKWTWYDVNVTPKRRGFDVDINDWSESVPWGAPNVANAYRPQVHKIDAFSDPVTQENEIIKLLQEVIKDKVKTVTSPENETGMTDYEVLLENIKKFQTKIAESVKTEKDNIEENINNYIKEIFNNYSVQLDINPENNVENTYSPFKELPDIYMGPKDGFKSRVSAQGSGARRTLMWSALKYLAEHGKDGNRPHVLLLDEPELCLHPSAIRDAQRILYDLPKTNNWQVMVTTHSPIFIDLSRDNTTIIRVDRNTNDAVRSTTLYRPEKACLSDDDKDNLKLLNICDPYIHEFFFGGRVVVVEGDTEYTAFSQIKNMYPEEYNDVHIIRARGKGVIPSVIKILNQFNNGYGILHDADTQYAANGNNNPAWTLNSAIMDEINKSNDRDKIVLIACKKNFEDALMGKEVTKDKPYSTYKKLKEDDEFKIKVKNLLDALLNKESEIPAKCIMWNDINELV